jgi:uncharacterized membrane protein YhhN
VLAFAALTAAATAALLLAERAHWQAGVWIAKPLASAGFIGVALAGGAFQSGYGTWLLLGLVLAWLGDVLLIPRGAQAAFLAGLVSFLLAHVAYAIAFAVRGLDPTTCLVALVAVLPASLLALRGILPHVPVRMRRPVLAYVVVISTMLVCAAGTVGHERRLAIGLGAFAFYLSDLAVARERFVAKSFVNKLWGLPLYFGAQLLLASTVAG